MEIKIKKLTKTAKVPYTGTPGSAGRDLYADIASEVIIDPGHVKLIPTGIAIEIPPGYFGAVYPRSGLAFKQGLRLANCTAVIDEDYRGNIIVALYNDSDDAQVIFPGMRIAQIVFQKYEDPDFDVVEDLNWSERGFNGFGSTGG